MPNNKKLAILFILIGILGRIIPHPANVTPITNLCIFSGRKLSRVLAMMTILITMAISDILLALIKGYPAFGSWTLFTYSGFIAITLLYRGPIMLVVLSATLGYWLWTNFGVWWLGMLTTHYTHNLNGLIACYIAALPFLRNALLGNLLWMIVIFAVSKNYGGYAYENTTRQGP